MDLRDYLRAIRKYWWIVLFVTLLGAGAGLLRTERATPRYAGKVTFFVSTPSESGSSAFNSDQFAQRRANSYAGVLTSERLAELVINKTGLPMSADQVSREIQSSVQLNTVLLTATVIDPSADRALKIATAIATQFNGLVDQLDNASSSGNTPAKSTTVRLNVVSGPSVSGKPVSPRPRVNLTLGIAIGLLLGLATAVVRELADTTVRTPDALRKLAEVPVLATMNYDSAAKRNPLVVGNQLRSARAEAFRQLRTNLQFIDVDNPVQVLVVTSSTASEGKTTTATNLAIVFAEANESVLLIEADMRRPRVTTYLGIERAVGLTNVLAGQVELDDVLQQWGPDGPWVLPSGSIPPNPSELLGSKNMVDLVETLRGRFDMVIIDTPPLLPVTDAAVAAALADGVVVLVRYGKTSRTQVLSAVRSLKSVDARLLGSVFNMRPAKSMKKGGYDGYGYYEDKPATGPSLDELPAHGDAGAGLRPPSHTALRKAGTVSRSGGSDDGVAAVTRSGVRQVSSASPGEHSADL